MFKRVTLFFSCTVFLLSAAQRDVAFLLQHADFELKNPLLFQEGLYDLALVFEHGLYRDDPVLEKKFINLIRSAQQRGATCSGDALIALEDLSGRVFSVYRGTRYALDLTCIQSKKNLHCFDEGAAFSVSPEKKEKVKKKRHKKEICGEQQSVSLLDLWGCNNAYRSRTRSARGASKKQATTRKAKASKPKKERVKKMTKKEKAALVAAEKDALIQNVSSLENNSILGATLDVTVKPTRKKQTRQKKESIAYSNDASSGINISEEKPKRKRASKKKEASDVQNQNVS